MAEQAELAHTMLHRLPQASWRRWARRNRSPLARKIIIFNVLGLLVLVFGVLYLNQSDNTAFEQTTDMLTSESRVIAVALRGENAVQMVEQFQGLADPSHATALLFDTDRSVMSYLPGNPSGQLIDSVNRSSALIVALQAAWQAVAGFGLDPTSSTRGDPLEEFTLLAARASQSNVMQQESIVDTDGQLYLAVAAPIGDGRVVLLSTRKGEVDARIRASREGILEVFVLAVLCSIILSVVLANSIARPLRQLVNATDVGAGRINPARIRIPDMSRRPDEVGDLSRALQSMVQALYQRIEENQTFAADVAHEIKNPLTSLRSAVETFGYAQTDADRAELLAIIRVDVDRMDRLVTDISNASRLEAEMVRDAWEAVPLDRILGDLLRHHQLQADAQHVAIQFEKLGGNFNIRGLQSRLAQVFANIIGNGLSFMPQGGAMHVRLRRLDNDSVEVTITDSGPGIPKDNLKDIFRRFYSSRPDGVFGDHSGLGLAISQQIVAAHGGTIVAGNRTDGQNGAVFTVTLPQ